MTVKYKPVSVGNVFSRLTVLRASRTINHRRRWLCRCVCGNETVTDDASLKNGSCRSCGCLQKEHARGMKFRHGLIRSPEYGPWRAMLRRCRNRSGPESRNYGARGIRVCARWRKSFLEFRSDVGPRVSSDMTLDRIDNNRGYYPGNVRWATRAEQACNRRNNVFLIRNGVKKTVVEWARELHLSPGTIRSRLRRGWAKERALTSVVGGNSTL